MMDRWRALSTRTQLLVMVLVVVAIGFVMYLGAPSDPDSEESPTLAGQRACLDALRGMKSASERSVPTGAAMAPMEAAAARLAPVAADYPRLATLALAIEQARQEVAVGQANGPFGQALARECLAL
jgi:hypothetical protein